MENLITSVAFIKPTPTWIDNRGEYNGYVAVPKDNIYFEKDYDEIPIIIHGGLTFGEPSNEILKHEDWLSDVEFIIGNELPKDYFIFGFDTCHSGDNSIIWNRERVIKETLKLFEQFKNK